MAPKSIEREMLIPLGAARHHVSEDQLFVMAVPIRSPDPEFPAAPDHPPSRLPICVSFVVTGEGEVDAVEIVDQPACPASTSHADGAFGQAVVSAVSRWTFFGAAICDFPADEVRNDDCEGEGVRLRPVPIRLTYVFTFDSTGGKAAVSSRRQQE